VVAICAHSASLPSAHASRWICKSERERERERQERRIETETERQRPRAERRGGRVKSEKIYRGEKGLHNNSKNRFLSLSDLSLSLFDQPARALGEFSDDLVRSMKALGWGNSDDEIRRALLSPE
jgi:hypothetical protein